MINYTKLSRWRLVSLEGEKHAPSPCLFLSLSPSVLSIQIKFNSESTPSAITATI